MIILSNDYNDDDGYGGLCAFCKNFDGEGHCDKYEGISYNMFKRKKKCKHYRQVGQCEKCNCPEFLIENSFFMCFQCGSPYRRNSWIHKNIILNKILMEIEIVFNDRVSCSWERLRSPKWHWYEKIRLWQSIYLKIQLGEN